MMGRRKKVKGHKESIKGHNLKVIAKRSMVKCYISIAKRPDVRVKV